MSGNDAIMRYPYGSFLMTRLDLVLLRDDELQAQIMRIIEYKMVRLREKWQDEIVKAIDKGLPPPPEPEHYWVTLSQGQIIAHLFRFNSAKAPKEKKNTISKGTVRKAMNALIEDVYVLTRSQPGKEFQATQYTLNTKLIEEHMWTRLPKEPWSYLGYSGKGEFEAVSPEPGGELQILKLGGVTNFETGELQNVNLPLTNLESGELQNLKVLIESLLESRRDTKEDKTTGTVTQVSDDCDAADADRLSLLSSKEIDDLVLGLRGNRQAAKSKTGPLPTYTTGGGRISETPFDEENAPPLSVVGGTLPLSAESSSGCDSETHPSQPPLSSNKPSVASSRGHNDGITQPSLMGEAHLNTTSSQLALRKEPAQQDDTGDRIATQDTGNAPDEQKEPEQPAPTGKGKGGRKKNDGIDMTPTPPPARPSADMPWGVEKMMAWCDYARKSRFKVSTRSDTKYVKALDACKQSVGRGITENNFLIIYFNRMKGIDLDLNDLDPSIPRSEGWQDYPVDAWVFNEHYEDEAKKYRRAKEEKGPSQKRKDETAAPPTRQPQNPLKASEEWKKRMAAAQGGK